MADSYCIDDINIDDSLRWANNVTMKNKKEKYQKNEADKNRGVLSYFSLSIFETIIIIAIILVIAYVIYSSRLGDDAYDNNIVEAMKSYKYSTPVCF